MSLAKRPEAQIRFQSALARLAHRLLRYLFHCFLGARFRGWRCVVELGFKVRAQVRGTDLPAELTHVFLVDRFQSEFLLDQHLQPGLDRVQVTLDARGKRSFLADEFLGSLDDSRFGRANEIAVRRRCSLSDRFAIGAVHERCSQMVRRSLAPFCFHHSKGPRVSRGGAPLPRPFSYRRRADARMTA